MTKVGIIDIGIGNTHSLSSALERAGYTPTLIDKPETMATQQLMILPGVGAYAFAMDALIQKGFDVSLRQWIQSGKPLIGICLGMQLLYEVGLEMGSTRGLGFLKGTVSPLPNSLKVPHMGWNALTAASTSPMGSTLKKGNAVYFVHSYYVADDDPSTHIATCDYGVTIPAIVQSGQILGFQFHPEKSDTVGQMLISQIKEVLTW